MGVRTLLQGLKNRFDGKAFEVWEEANGFIQAYLNGSPLVSGMPQMLYKSHIRKSLIKLADTANGNCHIQVIGHSVVDGTGAGATEAQKAQFGFPAVLRAALASRLGVTANEGLLWGGENPARFTLVNTSFAGSTLGFGTAANLLNATQTMAVTVTGSTMRVYMYANQLNVALTATSDAVGATVTIESCVALPGGGGYAQISTIALGTNASHNVIIIGPASGGVTILSVEARASATSGLMVSRTGQNGTIETDWFGIATKPTDTGGRNYSAGASIIANEWATMTLCNPDLVLLMFDLNNLTNKLVTYGYGYDLTRIQYNIQTVVNAYVALGIDVLLVVGAWRNPANGNYTAPYSQDTLDLVYQTVAANTDGCAFIDVRPPFASFADGYAAGYYGDTEAHPAKRGASAIGSQLANALLANS